jgi:DMSO/TMAO reductase YedYZ molybdopterin-dependent catalytic subunit
VQGFPVNKTAIEAGVTKGIADVGYALVVESDGAALHTFTVAELRAMPMHSATLPIACVEGWSASKNWTGVSVRTLLDAAGAQRGRHVGVESLQGGGRYRRSVLTPAQADEADTLLAMFVDGEPLAPDHGYPLRLIGPARPGVLQTKWVNKLVLL